jgi:O-antigen ligase
MRLSFLKLSIFLSFLLPVSLIFSRFVTELIVLEICIFFLIKIFISKEFFYFKNKLFYIFIFFWSILLMSSIFSDNIIHSLKTAVPYLRFGIFSLGIFYFIKNDKNYIKYFFFSLLLTIILLLFDSYIQLIFGYNLLGYKKFSENIVTSFFHKEIILGSYLIRLSSLLIALYYFYKPNNNYILILFFLIIEPMIYFSGSRTPFYLSLILILALIAFIKFDKKVFVSFLICFFIIGFSFYKENSEYKERMYNDLIDNYKKFKPKELDLNSQYKYIHFLFLSPGQTGLWITSLNMFNDKKLLGHGPQSFRLKCDYPKYKTPIFNCSTHSHNFMFQLLAETGILGFFCYIIIFILIIRNFVINIFERFYKNVKLDLFKTFLLLSFFINFFPLFPNGNFFNNWLNILMYLPFGFLLYKSELKNKR